MIIHITAKSSSTSCRQHKWQCFVLVMALLEMVVRGKEMESVTLFLPKGDELLLASLRRHEMAHCNGWNHLHSGGHMEEVNKLKPTHKGGVQLRLE